MASRKVFVLYGYDDTDNAPILEASDSPNFCCGIGGVIYQYDINEKNEAVNEKYIGEYPG